jgi:hypothetical protein
MVLAAAAHHQQQQKQDNRVDTPEWCCSMPIKLEETEKERARRIHGLAEWSTSCRRSLDNYCYYVLLHHPDRCCRHHQDRLLLLLLWALTPMVFPVPPPPTTMLLLLLRWRRRTVLLRRLVLLGPRLIDLPITAPMKTRKKKRKKIDSILIRIPTTKIVSALFRWYYCYYGYDYDYVVLVAVATLGVGGPHDGDCANRGQ